MNIHEYQAKELLRNYGIPVPRGLVAHSADEATAAAKKLSSEAWVVKAQIHAGGRGKGGGIKVCQTLAEVEAAARTILGMMLVTPQTGPQGQRVNRVLVEQATDIARELYLAIVLDRAAECLTVIASPDGGMDIEEVGEKHPERIFSTRLDGSHGIWPFQIRQLMFSCGLDTRQVRACVPLIMNLVRLCVDKDAMQVEINPLAIDGEGNIIAVDAKLNFDESALRHHPDIQALEDPDEMDPLELKAKKLGVNYVRLDGYVGTVVNGAGLAMATMDAIKQAGAVPANFLDVGGGASMEMVKNAFEVVLADAKVRGILINVFGGILRCDVVAEGIIHAAREVGLNLPIVVRMEGTNVEQGRKILDESGVNILTASTMAEAAEKIAELTGDQ